MTQTNVIETTSTLGKTCATCQYFVDYDDQNRGECRVFDQVVRKQNLFTSDCRNAILQQELEQILLSHKAFVKPISNRMPCVYLFKQLPSGGYQRVGYVSQSLIGWFANDNNGFRVTDRLPHRNQAIAALLENVNIVKLDDRRSIALSQTKVDLTAEDEELELTENLPRAEFEPGMKVKVIDPAEHHTEWGVFVVISKVLNNNRFSSTGSYLEPDWLYLISSPNSHHQMFWVYNNEICHVDTASVF